MKRPTWVTVIGVLGIIFGILGLFGAGMGVLTPKMLKIQKEMFSNVGKMEKMLPKGTAEHREELARVRENFKRLEKMSETIPEWFSTWSMIIGIFGLFVNAIYIYAAITLLQLKKFAIKLFYATIALSISYSILLRVVYAMAFSSHITNSTKFGGIAVIILDTLLLIVVATGDKQAFGPRYYPKEVLGNE